ncbi:porin family protein [Reichenbachiella agarivorans]|uniref:Porin family protein n=1 Tax=Reichenbachiella agarivorans TaxID=2979464 RepID=A0ABY6CRB3_9BACT|nr:porin family protein [Reichenbachiella agarivorans]UXP33047.1 porin family protein [Reichenbachiella agarivorans]
MNISINKALIVVLIILSSFGASAQFNFGLKGGLNVSNFNVNSEQGDPYKDHYESQASFHFGIFGLYDITDKVFVQGEVNYSVKGFKYPENDIIGRSNNDGEVKLNYLSIPLLFGYSLTSKLSVLIGVELNSLLSSKDISELGEAEAIWIETKDFGIAGGIQYDITEKINLSARYVHGLTSQAEVIINPDLATYKNRLLQLSLAYKFK